LPTGKKAGTPSFGNATPADEDGVVPSNVM
jgi:hypothetical protein